MIRSALHMSAWPDSITLGEDGSALTSIMVTNTSEVIDAFTVEVLGVDQAWTSISEQRFSLFPGATQSVDITLTLPPDTPAADRSITIIVRSENDPLRFESEQVGLTVPPRMATSVALDPALVSGGRTGRFGLIISNQGNAPVQARAVGTDPEDLATFDFEPSLIEIAPGRTQAIEVAATGGRAWFGQPRARTFEFGLAGTDGPPSMGTFIQRPRVPRWLIALLGLLLAATIFALVLSQVFDSVVDEASVDDGVINDALDNDGTDGPLIPANPGTITGVLTTTTRSQIPADAEATALAAPRQADGGGDVALGVPAFQVEVFDADAPDAPLATAATDVSGRFTITNLQLDTPYLLLFSGAGYPEVWYAADSTGVDGPGDADPISIPTEDPTDLGEIQIGGIPVVVEGTVSGDAAGATIQLIRTGVLDPGVDAIVAETTVAPDGTFTLPDIPSPADLTMVVSKPGFGTTRRAVTIQPGDTLGPISIELRPAQGAVVGRVNTPDGPRGGVVITATDGTLVIDTVSYTLGDVGAYTLRNLSTPGSYTITASLAGYQSTSASVVLADGQTSPSVVDIALAPATGRLQGEVLLDGEVSGEIEITITGGDEIVRTIRPAGASSDAPGTYELRGLPVPGSYTLAFAGAGIETEVRVANLDTSAVSATIPLVNLRRSERTVSGIVTASGAPFSGAVVVLSDGAGDLRSVVSANDPAGEFAFANVPPGTYTLSASRLGALASVVPVTVSPGIDVVGQELTLSVQASISGEVDTGSVTCDLVARLFVADQFGDQPVDEIPVGDDNTFVFQAVDAPVDYIVAIASRDSDGLSATTSIRSQLSQAATIADPIPVSCTQAGS